MNQSIADLTTGRELLEHADVAARTEALLLQIGVEISDRLPLVRASS
jgi:hypothetical protein